MTRTMTAALAIMVFHRPSLALPEPDGDPVQDSNGEPISADVPADASADPPPSVASPVEDSALPIPARVELLEDRVTEVEGKIPARLISVYLDVGWFAVGGNGSGVRSDTGHRFVTHHGHVPADWVFVGDSLTTAINAQGEPADLGNTRAIKTDTIDSGGGPTLIVNALGLAVGSTLRSNLRLEALAQLMPRPGRVIVGLELAQVEFRPTNKVDFVLAAGKVDSALGIEYRAQDATRRLTVTPSLLCRYTCGRPYGLRGHLTRDALTATAMIATGDTFSERFETDARLASAKLPTVSGHVQWSLKTDSESERQGVELGVSASFGPQDGQSDLGVHQWHYGFDGKWRPTDDVELTAEFVQGRQQGSTSGLARTAEMSTEQGLDGRCGIAQCLNYRAGYVLGSWRANKWLTPYARADWRDARHQRGLDFLYVSRVVRGTFGFNFEITRRIVAKLEYSRNHELLGPQFPNDVITSSVVVGTE